MPPDDDLATALLIEPAPEALPPPQEHRRSEQTRLRRLPTMFVRVPVSWFEGSDPRACPFDKRGRLFLLLLHLSRWGQRPVALTSAVAKQIGLSRKERWRHLERLEADGWVSVERDNNKAATVRPIVIAG